MRKHLTLKTGTVVILLFLGACSEPILSEEEREQSNDTIKQLHEHCFTLSEQVLYDSELLDEALFKIEQSTPVEKFFTATRNDTSIHTFLLLSDILEANEIKVEVREENERREITHFTFFIQPDSNYAIYYYEAIKDVRIKLEDWDMKEKH